MVLPEDFKSTKLNLVEIHENLSGWLTYSYYSYRMSDSDLFQSLYFKELLNKDWGQCILSNGTYEKGDVFYRNWLKYRLKKPYGDDNVFVYLDEDWLTLLHEYLIPFLKNLEFDFLNHAIEFVSFEKRLDKSKKPSNEDILRNAAHLYRLLMENNIIHKENL
jgi:hypothetical protein